MEVRPHDVISELVFSPKASALWSKKLGTLVLVSDGSLRLRRGRTDAIVWHQTNSAVQLHNDNKGIIVTASKDQPKTLVWKNPAVADPWRRALRTAGWLGILHFYTLGDSIGKGCHGEVFRALDHTTRDTVAVKALAKSVDSDVAERIRREMAIYRKVDHPYIVTLIDVFEDHANVFLVLEYAAGGELTDHLIDGPLQPATVAVILRRILEAITYLHTQAVCYRDVKIDNVLCRDRGDPRSAVLADFSISHDANTSAGHLMRTPVGTGFYLSPQQLRSDDYSRAVDAWAVGVLLYLLVTANFPFGSEDEVTYYKRALMGDVRFDEPQWASAPRLRDLCQHLLVVDPNERWSAERALSHDALRQV